VKERLVDEGAMVRTGQTIATLEIDDLERELRQQQANLQTAQAATAELQAGTRSEEVAQASAAVSRLQAEADRATSDLTRQEGLFRKEVIATRDIEAARATQQAAQAALLETKERLRQLQNGPRPETMRQARSRVDSAAATLSLAQNRLEHAILQAPISGVVLAKHLEPGEQAAAGTPVITIGNLDEVWVRGFIPETDLGRIRVGQTAQVTSDTYRGKVYPGTITFIAQEAEFTPKNVQTEKERVKLVYRIKISLKNPNHELKPGMPVDATINTADQGAGNPR
jgi:HlyD family secretion protein